MMKFLNPDEHRKNAEDAFAILKKKIGSELPFAKIEHIGSTAVTRLVSKGDLDIFIGVNAADFESTLAKLKQLGFVKKTNTYRSCQLCMLECFDFKIDVGIQLVDLNSKHIDFFTFRDLLRDNPELANSYNQMKLTCVGLDADSYREKKSIFINEALKSNT